MQTSEYISVSDLNTYIKSYLENNYFLQDIYVKGEISNFKLHQSGTLYFAIKDEKCAINVVMFSSFAKNLKVKLKDGDLVLIRGRINIYEARGTISINAIEVLFDSKGMLLIQFEELKNKLNKEGLFDPLKKKALPKYPKTIGLITAPYGAAIQDMYKTIKSRWPLTQIYVFPSLVQGNEAKYDIIKQIKIADAYNLDVLICGRGGGSIEDLWAFNEEIVARAFFDCQTPIISAVGHEIDVTISDYVADARGLTPTDGAVKATPNINDVINIVKDNKNRLIQLFNNLINNLHSKVDYLKKSYVLTNPTKIYETYRYKIDDLESQLSSLMTHLTHQQKIVLLDLRQTIAHSMQLQLSMQRKNLSSLGSKLDALSPLKVLTRGYVFATKENRLIKKIEDVEIDDTITLSLNDGKVYSKVVKKEKK